MTPKGKRILLGILIAVGGVFALVISLAIGFGIWVTRPGELIDPGRLRGAEATGYAEWTLRLEDPGTEGFVDVLFEAARRMPEEVTDSLPPFVATWLGNLQEARARRDLEKTFPMLVAWTLTPGSTPDRDLHLLSLSARRLGNQVVLADWIAGLALGRTPQSSVHPYNGEKIYQFEFRNPEPTEATFFARRGAIFATSDLETARRAVDLLAEAEAGTRPATGLDLAFQRTSETDALRAAVTNQNGEIARIWEKLSREAVENPDDWLGIRSASFGGGLEADGAFEGVMELVLGEAGLSFASEVENAIELQFDDTPLELELQASVIDDGIRIDIRVPNLARSLSEWTRDGERRDPVDVGIR